MSEEVKDILEVTDTETAPVTEEEPELDPEAATSFLATMFPQELSAADYYAYALQHPRMGAMPYEELKD